MSNVYDMLGHKKVLFDEEVKDITYKEIMTIIVQRATEEGCKEIFSEEGIGCTKCWTKAVKKIKR